MMRRILHFRKLIYHHHLPPASPKSPINSPTTARASPANKMLFVVTASPLPVTCPPSNHPSSSRRTRTGLGKFEHARPHGVHGSPGGLVIQLKPAQGLTQQQQQQHGVEHGQGFASSSCFTLRTVEVTRFVTSRTRSRIPARCAGVRK